MLANLSIRDVVLIERLDLVFKQGLCALTGETGAGKSILLDALGLALGARAEARLLRPGSAQASVTAAFEVPPDEPELMALEQDGLDLSEVRESGLLLLRRTLTADGRSRAFVNDQPVSVALLRRLGDRFVEVQGQFEQRGLLDRSSHARHLDAHAGLAPLAAEVRCLWEAWRTAESEHQAARQAHDKARHDEDFLRHALDELERLAPRPGEVEALGQKRSLLKGREKVIEALNLTETLLGGEDDAAGASDLIAQAIRTLAQVSGPLGERLTAAASALERAEAEMEEAGLQLAGLRADLELGEESLAEIEDRYFALNDLARKHACTPDALPELYEDFAERLSGLESAGTRLEGLAMAVARARTAYQEAAERLSSDRHSAAARLDDAVSDELPPLKLEQARFMTRIEPLTEESWGPGGIERVSFEIATNPDLPPGPLAKIASGGELSRLLLALNVVLAETNPEQSLVFDEVDSGIGGATADAVGERLARLAAGRQVLVVTHSPQVAARASHHLLVLKTLGSGRTMTEVTPLDGAQRREEIARMLSGAEVTEEARAAASQLMRAAS
jgi:DNA repair protein RecN (Recombination protein N)